MLIKTSNWKWEIGENVCVLVSSSHSLNDDMMYFRYAKSLRKIYDRVVVMGVKTNLTEKSIKDRPDNLFAFSLPESKSRKKRFIENTRKCYEKILEYNQKETTVLFFSPDFIRYAKKLCKKGYKVVQVYVENYPLKLREKEWIPKPFRALVAFAFSEFQRSLSALCYANIFVDSFTMKMEGQKAKNAVLLPNYPIAVVEQKDSSTKKNQYNHLKLVYVGGISKVRGLQLMIDLMEKLPKGMARLHLFGKCETKEDEQIFYKWLEKDDNVEYEGFLPYDCVLQRMSEFDVGLSLYERNQAYEYISENTTKIFEYMEFGLPIIAQAFPGLKRIVEDEDGAGICIDTSDKNWVKVVELFLRNHEALEECSKSGRNAFWTNRNWKYCEKKLFELLETDL